MARAHRDTRRLESVLNDFFDIEPLIDDREYPFICKPVRSGGPQAT